MTALRTTQVSAQLPRSADDCDFVVYRVRFKKRKSKKAADDETENETEEVCKLETVRKDAIRDYLDFFSRHHKYFSEGIKSRDGATVWIPPIHIDQAAIDALPDDGRPEGLKVTYIDDEVIDDDAPPEDEDEDKDESSDEADGHVEATDVDVNGSLIAQWLRDGRGNIAKALLASHPDGDTERIMSELFNVEFSQTVRPSSVKLSKLTERAMSLTGASSNVAAPHSGDSAVVRHVLYSELRSFVTQLGIKLDDSGCVHGSVNRRDGEDLADEAVRELQEEVEGDGSRQRPFECPRRGEMPLSETGAPGYMTMAFPTLFPFGRGCFSDDRSLSIGVEQWMTHLHSFYDDRFKSHPRWPFFAQNTRERRMALEKAQQYVSRSDSHGEDNWAGMTLGELKALSKDDRYQVPTRRKKEREDATMRSTPPAPILSEIIIRDRPPPPPPPGARPPC